MKRLAAAAALFVLAACGGGGGSVSPPVSTATPAPEFSVPSLDAVQRISSDPFTNGGSEHATEVEPGAAANGTTVVAAFQSGRFYMHGASDISTATSLDGGASWISASLPATTHYALPSGPYDSISDPSVAYDARHATWIVSALPVNFTNAGVPGVVVSRSPDGLSWSAPAGVTAADESDNDKDWIACDNRAASPYYGHCYVEWDNANSGLVNIAVSVDGGATWAPRVHPAGQFQGIGGQPVVLPDGTVAVLIDSMDLLGVYAFSSHDGGVTWSAPAIVQPITDHLVDGNLRYVPFVSAAGDGAGTIYAVWPDCRYRTNCTANDVVLSHSAGGSNWSAPSRVPIDPLSSTADHFLPGLSADAATSASGAHLGLTFYAYADANCTAATCALSANFIASQDGGATWGAPKLLAGPMSLTWLASTQLGAMIGDYTASVFASGRPIAIVPLGLPANGAFLSEAMYAPNAGTLTVQSFERRSSAGERPVRNAHADHGPRRVIP